MNPALPPARLRPLPRTVAPLHLESQGSYLQRLAAANRLTPAELEDHLQGTGRIRPLPPPSAVTISQLARQPIERLLSALPELRRPELTARLPPACRETLDEGWVLQPACRYCLAARGVYAATHWRPRGTRVCLRHQRWTGAHGQQFDISALTEIVRAQRRHHELARRHGWRRLEMAMREAAEICGVWWERGKHTTARDHRLKALPHPGWAGTGRELVKTACGYPETVELAALLANPALRTLPFTGRPADLRHFLDLLGARVAPGYRFDESAFADPLIRWYTQERHHRAGSRHSGSGR
jgi:hypothetical protein